MSATSISQSSSPFRLVRTCALLLAGLLVGGGLLLLAMMSSIAFGAAEIAPSDVWAALFTFDPTATDHLIIRTLRVPRAAVAALVGASLAVAGTIGFVGLMAPHIGRRLVGPDHIGLLPTAGVIGALIVVAADLVGRTIFAPIELPCGLITAVVGAPFFIYLLWQQRSR